VANLGGLQMSSTPNLLPVVFALAGALIGAVLGAGLQYLFGGMHGAKKRLTAQKDVAYSDFFTALSLLSKGDTSNDWRSRMADAKVRICLYGAPRVIESLAALENTGANGDSAAGRAAIMTLLGEMRRDVGTERIAAIKHDIEGLILGPETDHSHEPAQLSRG
jgi:hypothetical protein